jgi:hypothetical protein
MTSLRISVMGKLHISYDQAGPPARRAGEAGVAVTFDDVDDLEHVIDVTK